MFYDNVCDGRQDSVSIIVVSMAQFGAQVHVNSHPDDPDYMMGDEHYRHNNGITSPRELGGWMDDQNEGGGKFRLKRRRRCGQCAPCQVKENCGKCQYCLRKDVLKQACIYRKCVHLRKPVSRYRTETGNSTGSVGGGCSGAVAGCVDGRSSSTTHTGSSEGSSNPGSCCNTSSGNSSSAGGNVHKRSPQKTSLPVCAASVNNDFSQAVPPMFNSHAISWAAQHENLNSCQLGQTPFCPPLNNGMLDPLRAASLIHPHSAPLATPAILGSARNSYLTESREVESGRSSTVEHTQHPNTADSIIGPNSAVVNAPLVNINKERSPSLSRDQYRFPLDQWRTMSYAFHPSNPWAHPAFQSPPSATPYGFQHSVNHYASPFGSSCRLSMDPSGHLASASPHQHSFPHTMPFVHPDFPSHSSFRPSTPHMSSSMTPPFFQPPPPHIHSSLPNLPSLGQLQTNSASHSAYPITHPHMYASNFYSSFRPPTEPQIYNVRVSIQEHMFSVRPVDASPFYGTALDRSDNFCLKHQHDVDDDEGEKKSVKEDNYCKCGFSVCKEAVDIFHCCASQRQTGVRTRFTNVSATGTCNIQISRNVDCGLKREIDNLHRFILNQYGASSMYKHSAQDSNHDLRRYAELSCCGAFGRCESCVPLSLTAPSYLEDHAQCCCCVGCVMCERKCGVTALMPSYSITNNVRRCEESMWLDDGDECFASRQDFETSYVDSCEDEDVLMEENTETMDIGNSECHTYDNPYFASLLKSEFEDISLLEESNSQQLIERNNGVLTNVALDREIVEVGDLSATAHVLANQDDLAFRYSRHTAHEHEPNDILLGRDLYSPDPHRILHSISQQNQHLESTDLCVQVAIRSISEWGDDAVIQGVCCDGDDIQVD